MKKLLTFLTLLTLFFGVGWAAENDVHDMNITQSTLLNNNASIPTVNIAAQSYPIKKVTINWRYNKTTQNVVTIEVKVGGESWGTKDVGGNTTADAVFEGTSTTGAVEIIFTNHAGSGTGKGTFYVNSVTLTEGGGGQTGPTAPTGTITFNPASGEVTSGTKVAISFSGTCDGIKYTTDGTEPSANNGTVYDSSNRPTITGATTLKAAAYNYSNSQYAFGTVFTVTYTLTASNSKIYQRITSTDDLEIGKKYIIIYSTSATNINAYVLGSNTPSATTRPFVTKDISEDRKITVGPNDAIAQFTLGGGPDAYTLLCDNESYLNGQSNSQYLKIIGDGTDNYSKWNITFDGNYAKINNKGNTSYYVSWYANQQCFNLYTRYTGIYLYKEYIPKAYNVTVTQAEGGTITASPEGEKVVDAGDKITVTATPADGYELSSWTITGASESAPDANNQITATGNVTITATFGKVNYAINTAVSPAGGGEVWMQSGFTTIDNVATSTYGTTVSVKLHTNSGYMVDGITVVDADDNPITTTLTATESDGKTYSFTMPASSVTITGLFAVYHPTLKMGGLVNGSTWISDAGNAPAFTYDATADKYTASVYFTGNRDEQGTCDYFFLFEDGTAKYPSANGNFWITSLDGTTMNISLTGGSSNNFRIVPGVYDIEINGGRTTMKVTQRSYTLAFSPADDEVEQGTSVSASCQQLVSDIAAINSGETVTVGVNTDNGSTWNASETLNTIGSTTVYGKAYINNLAVTGNAAYTVVKANLSNKYQLATTLTPGKKYIIVSEAKDDVMGAYVSGNTRYTSATTSGYSLDKTNHIVTLNSGSDVTVLTLGGTTGAWTLLDNDQYLTWNSGNTLAQSATATTNASKWNITLNEDNAVISNLSDSQRQIMRNSGSAIFACYTGTQTAVQLYQQMVEEEKDYTITYAEVTGGSATGATEANEGEQITVTVTANDGYAATGITVNPSVEVTDNHDGTYTFTMPASNVTVTPSFAQAYAITYVAEPAAGGIVTGVPSAVYDARVEVTVTPNADYQLSGTPTYTYNGITQQLAGAGTVESPYYFNMPGYATTVTANFVKIPHGITIVSTHGDVTGIPATATSGTQVTFTVTPNAGYVVSSVSGTFNNGNSSLNITDNGDGTYTFNMPAYDVAITVTYFASEDYELLTDLADINEEDTYLIVGGPASDLTSRTHVMGNTYANTRLNAIELTENIYDDETGVITSTANMSIVNFVPGSGENEGKWAIHNAAGYLYSNSSGSLSIGSTPYYAEITLDENSSRAYMTIGSVSLTFNSNSPMFRFYSQQQGAAYIFKLANKNKVKRPTITGAAGEFLGQYNFIGKDNVSMACTTEDAVIEYSLDGGNTWQSYSKAFEISTDAAGNTVDVMARATKTGMEPSDAVTATFTCIKPTAPTFGTNEAGAYVNPVFVYPKSALKDRRAYGEESVSFCYTTDGTDADALSMEVATSNSNGYYIVLDDNATLSVVTVINDIASDPAGGEYTFSVDAPAFSLAGGNYDGNQQTRLSTNTKTQQNNLSWNTVIYYTTGNTEFEFNATTGEVTSEGWIAYDPTNSPYIDILAANGTTTIKAVTLSNYFNGQSEYRASDVTSETYVLTAANLSITISPAAGTYVNAQNVTLGVKNNIGDYIIYYTTDGSDPNTNGTEYTGTPITVDHDMTIKVYAVDSRTGDGGTATAEAVYKIGIQPVVYSPFPGTIYKGNDEDINVEMFSVTPNAKIYYTVAEGEDNLPTDPTTSSTLYSEPIPLETGKVYNFKAIAVIGSLVSTVTPGTFTVEAKGSGWLNVNEMANSSQGTSKTLENPVQVIYMSKYRNGDPSVDYPGEPEYCFVRDNSGYGLIYFGAGNISTYENYKVFEMGDWIEGGTISGAIANWNSSFINELGGGASTNYRVTNWPSSSLGNTAILPEETTNKAITDGWTYEGAYTGSNYKQYIDPDKNLFGHYVHMRKNTITNVTGAGGGNGKHTGIITDQSDVPLNYYDGFYLFSGYNGSVDYDQTFFNQIQQKGGTFDIYAVVTFYGPNASNSSYSNAPYEIFPIDFEWIYKPLFNIETGTYYEPQTISLTCETEGAQIWYKTSEMEAYELYTGPFEVDATTTIETYSTLPSKYNDVLESVINSITVTIGTVDAPVITEPSVVKTVGESVTTDITCTTEGATIYYTTDGSDPKSSETRIEYTLGQQLTFDETTTVRAIAMQDGFYSVEAESRTYTFVKSNGIEYTLVTNVNQLNENSVYVIVNKANNMAMSTNQRTNNRGAAGVMFKNADKTIVYGNDDLAQFTLKKTGNNWYIQTNNSSENGFLSVGNGNTLLTSETANGNAEATITIDGTNADVDKASEAHISFIYNNETTRYMRYWNRDLLFNTYTTETNAPVFLYYIEATPLATIEKDGVKGTQYTIADELLAVHAFVKDDYVYLWCKDQGNVSIAKTENTNDYVDYMRDIAKVQTEDWDQSNWVVLKFQPTTGNYQTITSAVNHYIKPAMITGIYSDDVNYTITMPVNEGIAEGVVGDEFEYSPNWYCTANFLTANHNGNATGHSDNNTIEVNYFFMNPKIQEVCEVTYAVWNGNNLFVVPAANGTTNDSEISGAFNVDWTYNASGNVSEALDLKTQNDGYQAYKFRAIVQRPASSKGIIGTKEAATVTPADGMVADESYIVYPVDLDPSNAESIVTAINSVNVNGKAVKSVKYVNVAGIVSDHPFQGVNIVVTEYTDGTRTTSKMLRK